MATDRNSRAYRGQPLRMSADLMNDLRDMAREWRTGQFRSSFGGDAKRGSPENPVSVIVKNNTGATIPQFGVMQVASPIILPTLNPEAWSDRRAFIGTAPTASALFVITQEPIAAEAIGSAVIAGVTPCELSVTSESDTYAAPTTSTRRLTTGTSGPARILWKETGTGNKRGVVVLLGATPSAASGASPLEYFRHVGTTNYFTTPHATTYTPATVADNTMYLIPYPTLRGGTLDRIGIAISVAGFGTSNYRLGAYSTASDTDLRPGALLFDAGEIASPSAGVNELTISQALTANTLIWLALLVDTTVAPTLTNIALDPSAGSSPMFSPFGFPVTGGSAFNNSVGVRASQTYGALPDPAPSIASYNAANPLIFVRYSA